jgi:hypothetical protein
MASVRIAAALTVLIALGFALPAPWVIERLRRTGALPTFFGLFPMYGGPAFERVSHTTFSVLLASFSAVLAVDVVAGWLLWRGDRAGAVLTLALVPVEAAYWAAFALPIPPMMAVVRIALIAIGWRALA